MGNEIRFMKIDRIIHEKEDKKHLLFTASFKVSTRFSDIPLKPHITQSILKKLYIFTLHMSMSVKMLN